VEHIKLAASGLRGLVEVVSCSLETALPKPIEGTGMNDVDMVLTMMADPQVRMWLLVATVALSLPPVLVLFSKRVAGGTKVLWFVLTSTFSWIAYVPFLYITRKPKDRKPAP
jgi:hypothetical protein